MHVMVTEDVVLEVDAVVVILGTSPEHADIAMEPVWFKFYVLKNYRDSCLLKFQYNYIGILMNTIDNNSCLLS
jgi:hypothetical protein